MHVLLGMISRPETNQKSQQRIAQSKRIALYIREKASDNNNQHAMHEKT